MILTFFSDYKKNTNEFYQEEFLDFFIYRPLAFLLVKTTYFLPLTPNHFSVFALLISVLAGYFISTGTINGFICGGIGIFLFGILDCSDGMIARMKKNGHEYGIMIDMFVDAISGIIFYSGLFIGLNKFYGYSPLHYLSFVSGVSSLIHAGIYNFHKKQYFFYLKGDPDGRRKEIEFYSRKLDVLNTDRGKWFEKILLILFLVFTKFQKRSNKIKEYDVKAYLQCNKPLLPMWGGIAGSSHLFFLALFVIIGRIDLFFITSIILFNLWIFFILVRTPSPSTIAKTILEEESPHGQNQN